MKLRRLCVYFSTFFLIKLLLLSNGVYAQKGKITGTVSDKFGPLPGAHLIIVGTTIGTSANVNGVYTLEAEPGTYQLKASFVTYAPVINPVKVTASKDATVSFMLKTGSMLDEVVELGSRTQSRSLMETAVPVDVYWPRDLSNSSQTNVGQILQYLAPSFHSTHQTISDGTDHIDPATLRGLGPDQVLVLINGKRRHTSSLVNVNGTVGRGTVGTDLNAIPIAAVDHIEILRDGAAAQYGSDAIAGVINIVLKEQTGIISGNVTTGITQQGDGLVKQANANYGFEIGNGGFVNVTGDYTERGSVNRSGDYTGTVYGDARDSNLDSMDVFWANTGYENHRVMEIGNSATTNASMFFNSVVPIKAGVELYANGGFNFRKGEARGFYRFPKDENKVVLELYRYGFSPQIHTDIHDRSFTAGIRGEKNEWITDFSNTVGSNKFDFTVKNSDNASLGTATPTTFYCGGFQYSQNTSNLDISRKFDSLSWVNSVNMAFGAEFRLENYRIIAGEDASWIDGSDTLSDGSSRKAGAQVFPGFQPQNELIKNRTNTAAYIDIETEITSKLLFGTAARYELYSDFGDNFTWKLVSRYKVTDRISVRGAYNTGFRAPSLHQLYFNNLSTQFIGGVAVQVGTFNNQSTVTKAFGIKQLEPEISNNASLGVTAKLTDHLSLTIDGYLINIKDRIVLSGRFDSNADPLYANILDPLGAGAAQFFTNAVDTKTQGIDVVSSYYGNLGPGRLTATLAANFTETKVVGDIKAPDLLKGKEDILYNREEISRIEVAQPNSKINLLLTYEVGKWYFLLRNTRFGVVEYIDPKFESRDQVFSPKIITDLSISYKFNNNLKLTIGANNILDVYPDKHEHSENINSGMFVYSRRVQQFGVNGAFYFAKMTLSL
ncbi:MAG: TonB-dependent receptor [Cytophagales bacterium]|nr:TonB-dependent receptor [Cytophagales bacterium]